MSDPIGYDGWSTPELPRSPSAARIDDAVRCYRCGESMDPSDPNTRAWKGGFHTHRGNCPAPLEQPAPDAMVRCRKCGLAYQPGPLPECPVCSFATPTDSQPVAPAQPEAREPRYIEGTWGAMDPRRWFVAGAKWWEFKSTGATMWASDRNEAEAEAERRYGGDIGAAPERSAEQ